MRHPTARLLDPVPGRSGKSYRDWLHERGESFREGIQIATLDPFQGYKNAIDDQLEDATCVLDALHIVKLDYHCGRVLRGEPLDDLSPEHPLDAAPGRRRTRRDNRRPTRELLQPSSWSSHQHLLIKVLRRPIESVQFTSKTLFETCEELGIRQSMGRTGVCWDNAMAESFWATLKTEFYDRRSWPSRAETRREVARWIEIVFNRRRLHSSLDYTSPVAFENAIKRDQAETEEHADQAQAA